MIQRRRGSGQLRQQPAEGLDGLVCYLAEHLDVDDSTDPTKPETDEHLESLPLRALLAEGDVEEAAQLLGRPHEVRGVVVHGDGRGGPELGFPTANLAVADDIALPADAVYAGHYRRADGSLHQAAINVGRRPTFYEPGTAEVLVEAYLLHFDGDLYGEPARVSFSHRLRDEQRFDSVEALIAQMRADVEATEKVLATADLP